MWATKGQTCGSPALTEPRAASTQKRTRIQREKEALILEAALDVFSKYGFRGSTIDQVAKQAGLSKPNLLYYFSSKEAIHRRLLDRLLRQWEEPLRSINPDGAAIEELRAYIRRKLDLSRNYPRESRLFANEILQGAPRFREELKELRQLVDETAGIVNAWIDKGSIKACDPYHLIFSIWATTQHYADFDVQIRTVLGKRDESRFEDAQSFLETLYLQGLVPAKRPQS